MPNEKEKGTAVPPHGNISSAAPFLRMEVNDVYEVRPENYSKAANARSHMTRKMRLLGKKWRVISRAKKDDKRKVISYIFKRVE